jgi:hypothetical protein
MFDRFAIVGAYYLFSARFGYALGPARARRALLHSRALAGFRPSLTLNNAVVGGTRYVCQTDLPKNDDYQETRDAYARLLRRARKALRAERYEHAYNDPAMPA